MSDRLTSRNGDGSVYISKLSKPAHDALVNLILWSNEEDRKVFDDVFHKLADLEDKMERGELIDTLKLLGEKVWFIWGDEIYARSVYGYEYDKYNGLTYLADGYSTHRFTNGDLYETVFLTYEEAAAALKEMGI